MALYRMTYSIRGKWQGNIELAANSEEEAKGKAQKRLASYYEVEKDDVKITTIVDVEKAKVAA